MNVTKVVAQYEALAEAAHSASERVQFDPQNPQQLCAVALHGTLLEVSRALVALIKLGDATGTPILLRAMLEAYVDLSNVVTDEKYLHRMSCAWQRQRLRLAKAAYERGANNPYLESITEDRELATVIKEIQADLRTLKKEGGGELTIQERFELAGEQDRYDSVYAHLCSHGHNNLNALEERHIERTTNGYRVVFFRPIRSTEVQRYIDTMAGIIANAIAFVKQLTEDGEPMGLEDIGKELNKLRELYKDA